jgi:hypothetical protein
MSRTLFFAVATLAFLILASSFAVASYALGPSSEGPPQLRRNLPAAALPTTPLHEATVVGLGNLLRAGGADRFGITPDSYAGARRLASTDVGTFYLVPGSDGACIVTSSAASCGDPGSPGDPILALAKATAAGDELVGVGIATAGTERAAIPSGSRMASLPVSNGLFHIRERVSLPAIAAQPEAQAGSAPKQSPEMSVEPGGGGGNCTHYTRFYTIGWEGCFQFEWTPQSGQTSGVAIRYQNYVSYQDGHHIWALWYSRDNGDYFCCHTVGVGYNGVIGGSLGEYKAANCATADAGPFEWLVMYCATFW